MMDYLEDGFILRKENKLLISWEVNQKKMEVSGKSGKRNCENSLSRVRYGDDIFLFWVSLLMKAKLF